MGHTNNTPNYNLAVFRPTDKPSWMSDWNETMTAIDTALNGTKVVANSASNTAGNALDSVTALEPNVLDNTQRIQALENAGGAVPTRVPVEVSSGFTSDKLTSVKIGRILYVFGSMAIPGNRPFTDLSGKSKELFKTDAFGYELLTGPNFTPAGSAYLTAKGSDNLYLAPITMNVTQQGGTSKFTFTMRDVDHDTNSKFSGASEIYVKVFASFPLVSDI